VKPGTKKPRVSLEEKIRSKKKGGGMDGRLAKGIEGMAGLAKAADEKRTREEIELKRGGKGIEGRKRGGRIRAKGKALQGWMEREKTPIGGAGFAAIF